MGSVNEFLDKSRSHTYQESSLTSPKTIGIKKFASPRDPFDIEQRHVPHTPCMMQCSFRRGRRIFLVGPALMSEVGHHDNVGRITCAVWPTLPAVVGTQWSVLKVGLDKWAIDCLSA